MRGSIQILRGVRLRALDLGGCTLVSDAGLSCLVGMPLETLDLRWCDRVSRTPLIFEP